jgi:hypothetical protein
MSPNKKLPKKSSRKSFEITYFMILYIVLVCITYFFTPTVSTIEKYDIDKPHYTGQLQKLLLNEDTEIMYRDIRIISPLSSIIISKMFLIDYERAMILLTIISGLISIWVIYKYYGKTIIEKRLAALFYVLSPTVLIYSATYFIEITSYLFALIIFLLIQQAFLNTKSNKEIIKKWGILTLVAIFGILQKESLMIFFLISVVYHILFYYRKKLIAPAIISISIALIFTIITSTILFNLLSPHITNKEEVLQKYDQPLMYRVGIVYHNLSMLAQTNNILGLFSSIFFSYGFIWIFIVSYFLKVNNLERAKIIYFILCGIALMIMGNISSKYFLFATLPFMLPIAISGFMNNKRTINSKLKMSKIQYLTLLTIILLNVGLVFFYAFRN